MPTTTHGPRLHSEYGAPQPECAKQSGRLQGLTDSNASTGRGRGSSSHTTPATMYAKVLWRLPDKIIALQMYAPLCLSAPPQTYSLEFAPLGPLQSPGLQCQRLGPKMAATALLPLSAALQLGRPLRVWSVWSVSLRTLSTSYPPLISESQSGVFSAPSAGSRPSLQPHRGTNASSRSAARCRRGRL